MKQRLSTSSENDVKADPLLTFHLQGDEYANDILAAQDCLTGSQPLSGCLLYVHGLVNLRRETGVCLPDVLLCQHVLARNVNNCGWHPDRTGNWLVDRQMVYRGVAGSVQYC